jgi:curved DNA-binding protein CbpA
MLGETMDDHYEALGLTQAATPREIKSAFKQLALKYHPDQHPSPIANAIFRTLNEAYLVLSDPEKRRAYDEELRLRRAAPRGRRAPASPPPPTNPPPPTSREADASRQATERGRREGAFRRESARERSRKSSDLSHRAVQENDQAMRDLYAAAEADVEADERRKREPAEKKH